MAKSQHILARRAAKMAADSMTHRQIAAALGIRPEQVKARIALGQRLMQMDEPNNDNLAHGCGHMQGRGAP